MLEEKQEVYAQRELLPERSLGPWKKKRRRRRRTQDPKTKRWRKVKGGCQGWTEFIKTWAPIQRSPHPPGETGSRQGVVGLAAKFRCNTCRSGPIPSRQVAQRSDMKPYTFSKSVAIDLEFVNYTIELSQCAKKFLSNLDSSFWSTDMASLGSRSQGGVL